MLMNSLRVKVRIESDTYYEMVGATEGVVAQTAREMVNGAIFASFVNKMYFSIQMPVREGVSRAIWDASTWIRKPGAR